MIGTNYSKLERILERNGGYITRKETIEAGVNTWFLSEFCKKRNLTKYAPGFYADNNFVPDEYFILQKRYPKYIISGLCALYLHNLTDKIPEDIEVTAPYGYNPSRVKIDNLMVRRISSKEIYELGIETIETFFGNKVLVYDKERMICDMIKYRDEYDGETFVKAIKFYSRGTVNQIKLFQYAKIMSIEKKVFEIMEIVLNDD